jgi:hypothetical protein
MPCKAFGRGASMANTVLSTRWFKVPFSSHSCGITTEAELSPPELRPLLVKLAHSFRQSLVDDEALPSAAESFRQGWQDMKAGRAPRRSTWC